MQEFIGFDQNALAYNRTYTISAMPPERVQIENALVSPFGPTIDGNFLEELSGGVFDQTGQLVEASTQPRSDGCNGVCLQQSPPSSVAQLRLPRAVFGGVAFDHFGHFLLEATARLWCLPEYKDLPWLFLTNGKPQLSGYQIGFLEVLGLAAAQIVPVSELYHVDTLIVPRPSFVYHHHVTHAYRDTFRNAALQPDTMARRRIFLSRSNTTIARTVGEQELEAILTRDGWDIVTPELLPPREQAMLFHNTNIVMGLQGSAMHMGLFAPPGRRVVHLCRGAGYRGYYVLDDLMEADASYLVAMSEHRLQSKPITGPFMLDLDRTINFLRDRSLLSRRGAVAALPNAVDRARMDIDYQAWWHYTESQIRFHRQIDHDGRPVQQPDARGPAMEALALRPGDPEILGHAVALAMKFDGNAVAADLLDTYAPRLDQTKSAADAPLLHFRSIIDDGNGAYESALVASRRTLELAPGNASYVNQMATILYRLRRLDQAETILNTLLATGNATSTSYFMLSLVRHEMGDIPQGISLAQQALQMDWHDQGLCQHLANLLIGDNQRERARDVYQTFISRNANPDISLLLAAAALEEELDDLRAALTHIHAAHRLNPDDPEARARYIKALVKTRLFPDLANLAESVSPAVTAQSVMVYHHSIALAAKGDLTHALQVAVAAVEMNPHNDTIMLHLLGMMMKLNRPHDARLLAGVLIEKNIASGETFYVLSLIEGDLGRSEPARKAACRAAEMAPANNVIADHYRRLLPAA